MAKEENANPNNTKKNIMSNSETRKMSPHRRPPKHKHTLRREITERKKPERTPKKKSGMKVQVDATTEMMAKTRVDDEDEDLWGVTHRVTSGEFESFEGSEVKGNSHMTLRHITLRLIKDRSGHKMNSSQVRRFLITEVEELDSDDMIASIDTKSAAEEDKALIDYEKKLWECPKCQHSNNNTAGFCPNMVGGKLCGGTKKCKMLSWGNCFSQVCYELVFFFVIHLSRLT